MAGTRSETLGPRTRPVALPDDLADTSVAKATGRVRLALHVRWSEPIKAYNLDRREDRLRVYEQVPCEGTVDDIHTFVRLDDLIDLWGDLVIPENVRSAWRDWLVRHGAHLGC